MSDVNDYRFVRNAEAWKQRITSEDKAMLNFIRDYRNQLAMGQNPNSTFPQPQFVTRRNNTKPLGYSSHILPHLLTLENRNNMDVDRRAGGGSPGGMYKNRNMMELYETESVASSRSGRSGRSDKSARSAASRASNRSSASVNMMLLDEENQKRISELEKTLEQEKRGREEVVRELQSLKSLMQAHLTK